MGERTKPPSSTARRGRVLLVGAAVFFGSLEPGVAAELGWASKAAMAAGDSFGTAAVGGTIYVAGVSFNLAYAYYAKTNTWSSRASLPSNRNWLAAAAIGASVYAVGGWDASYNYLNTMVVYDPATNSWKSRASMMTARGGLGVVVVGGTLYAVGGHGTVFIDSIEAYDPATDSWTLKTHLSSERWSLGVAAIDSTIYVIGGTDATNYRDSVEAYDTVTGLWTTKTSMPTPRYALAVAAVGGTIFAMGGANSPSPLPTVEVYDSGTNSWSVKTDLPAALLYLGGAALGGTVYALGGDDVTALPTTGVYASYRTPAQPSVSVAVSPNPAVVGQWITVSEQVGNTGGITADGVTPALQLNVGGAGVVPKGGPVPAGPVNLPPGSTTTFVWTYSVSGSGALNVTATATGTDDATGAAVAGHASGGATLKDTPVSLVAAMALTPSSGCAGQLVTVDLTVTNLGSGTLTLGQTATVTGGVPAIAVSGPTPGAPVTLGGYGSVTVTWTYSIAGAGVFVPSASFSGYDATYATTTSTGAGTSGTYGTSASLVAALTAPATWSTGQWSAVVLTVTNVGGAPATGVSATLLISSGGTLVAEQGGMTPAGPVTIPGYGHQAFTWTYSASGAGPVSFTGSANGTDGCSGSPRQASAGHAATVQTAANLVAAATALPASVRQGQSVTVVLAATNTGQAGVAGLVPSAGAAPAPPGGMTLTSGPQPGGSASLPGSASRLYTWTYAAGSVGSVTFTATAAGTDANGGWNVTAAGTSAPVTVTASAVLKAGLSVNRTAVQAGDLLTATLTLSNTGANGASGVTVTLAPSDGTMAETVGNPTVSLGSIGAGAGLATTWSVLVKRAGTLVLTAMVQGADAVDATPVSAQASATATVGQRFADPVVAYPNPVGGDRLTLSLQLTGDAASVVIEVYNSAMDRVWQGTWRNVSQWDQAFAIDGVLTWAPGPYLVRARATLADGSAAKFKTVRVLVKR